MKKLRITAIILCLSLFILPVMLFLTGVLIEEQFDETYYGAYKGLVYRLRETEGKKIVIIGNSAIPFGIQSDLLQGELSEYQVVNFGLYGSIGTKAMMNAAKPEIGQGDIVILLPELNEQSLSLYFSGEQYLYAADGDFSLVLGQNEWESFVSGYPKFISEKIKYLRSDKKVDDVYSRQSFLDAEGKEKDYITLSRPHNVMPTGWDENNRIKISKTLFSDGFLAYVKEYQSFVEKKGAMFYFGFAPVNRLALEGNSLDILYRTLQENGICVLGTPDFSMMDYEWFFDSNFHLNTDGSTAFTALLAEQIKAEIGDDRPVKIQIPPKPTLPVSPPQEGNDIHADLFLYEEKEDFVRIIGLKEEGKNRSEIVIPSQVHGKKVISFDKEVFQNQTTLSKVTLGKNISVLYDGSFEGCSRLISLVVVQSNPNLISVGKNLLKGADFCTIYVPTGAEELFSTHYFWQYYKSRIAQG